MLSLDLFNSRYEKKLHEGAVDDAEYARLKKLGEKIDYLKQARAKTKDAEMQRAIDGRIKEYNDERMEILSVRGMKEAEQPTQSQTQQTKGIGDIQDPKQKMAQLAQQSKKGPLANVGAGLKAFIKGEPEPMDEEQQISPRALGVANFQRLVKANMGNIPTVNFEFIRPEENFKLDQRGLDLISDYYDGLENDQAKNYFIYRVLPSGDETLKVLKQLGWSPQQAQQTPQQGELPLQEKKKFKDDDLEAGDVKVARELQKLRAQYPGARSDVEAVARAEIDSTERNQRQLAAIRGANEKQDALLRQLVDLDQEQGREIDGLDKENNSLEQRLAQVQATNDRLQQAIGKMTGTKKIAPKTKTPDTPQTGSADIAKGGIIDVGAPVEPATDTKLATKPTPTTSPAMDYTVQQLAGFSNKPLASLRPSKDIGKDASNDPEQQTQKVSGSDIREHGGGIGPRQHWQSMMPEGQPQELINRYLAIDAENDVDAVRAAIQAISRDPALGANSKARLLGQIGMIIKRHRLPIGRSYYQFMQQYMESVELDRARVPGYPQDPATVKHRLDTAKAILGDPRSDADSRREAAAIVAKLEKPGVNETVENVRAGMAQIYHRLAPKIERHRDSFLAGQLYDELENYAELHGAEGEFKRMMSTARNRAHMEYDTNPGGFHNWFWFLPFEDDAMTEGSKPGEYYIHTVYFKDGTKKRIRVTSDEVDVADYYNKRGKAVDHVDYDFQLHSDMTEAEKEPTTRQELLNRVDKIQRMMTQERNPANLQILRKELEMLKQRYQHLREDSDGGEAVEMAIMRRMLVAHTDLIVEFGLDKVVQAIEEVAYNVGDTDEIGSSDVSGWVRQVEQILGVEA